MFAKARLQPLLLPLLITPIVLTGCKGGNIQIGPTDPPTSVAKKIEFTDIIPGNAIGGFIKVTRADDDSDATSYIVRWGSSYAPAPTSEEFPSNFITRFAISAARTGEPYSQEIYVQAPPSELNIDSILVYTSNSAGENSTGVGTELINVIDINEAPTVHPVSVTFNDSDDRVSIAGTVNFGAPVDETGITSYVVRLAGETGCPLQGNALGEVAQGSAYSLTVPARTVLSASRSIVVLAKNEFGEAYSDDCNAYAHSDPATFNSIVPSDQPYFMANRATFKTATGMPTDAQSADNDDSVRYHAYLTVQSSRDERDLGTGYYINLGDSDGNCIKPALAFLPPAGGNRIDQEVEIDLPDMAANISKILVSTGTECGFTANPNGPPHELALNNHLGDWYQIKSATSGQCLQVMDTEPTQIPDNDGQSNDLRLVNCDAQNLAQRFSMQYMGGGNENYDYYVYRVRSEYNGGCLWRRTNTDAQEWQVKKDCSISELGTELQVIARSSTNGYRNKTLAVRDAATSPQQFSCAIETADRLVSGWNNCAGSNSFFNFAPAGTHDNSQYAVLDDAN